jgi:hypothetical protein
MEVVTYSQLLERYTQYLNVTDSSPPPPIPTGNLTINLDINGYSVIENGITTTFQTHEELLAYLDSRFSQWEAPQ